MIVTVNAKIPVVQQWYAALQREGFNPEVTGLNVARLGPAERVKERPPRLRRLADVEHSFVGGLLADVDGDDLLYSAGGGEFVVVEQVDLAAVTGVGYGGRVCGQGIFLVRSSLRGGVAQKVQGGLPDRPDFQPQVGQGVRHDAALLTQQP